MKNFVGMGNTIKFTAGGTVLAGEALVIGTLVGVNTSTVYSGQEGVANLTGVYEFAKPGSQAWTLGAKVYWDAANKQATTTSSGNTLMGVAYEVVGSGAGETKGKVRLDGVCV